MRTLSCGVLLLWPALALASGGDDAGLWGPLSLAAPITALVLALVTRKVVVSLVAGSVVGAVVAAKGDPIGAVMGLMRFVGASIGVSIEEDQWSWSWDHLTISTFALLVAAMVGVIGRAGGTRALVARVEPLARSPRGAGIVAWLSGGLIFFDDYANCLVVGSAMGPVFDRFGVSRAKLSYVVDATAAPVASLAVVSTWVGYEIGLMDDAIASAGVVGTSGLDLFLTSLPHRFYSWFTLAFVFLSVATCREFGPMYAAEVTARAAARRPAESSAVAGYASTAIVPIVSMLAITIGALVLQGRAALGEAAAEASIAEILGGADPYRAMLYGSLVGMVLAVVLALRSVSSADTLEGAMGGAKSVGSALVVLYLAWTLGAAIGATDAATWLGSALGSGVPASAIPVVTFALAALTSFATGTSWGTMAMLFPLALPLALGMTTDPHDPVVSSTVGAILAGSCLGDHASPISDTTVLSALGSGVDLATHVRTQLPYVIVVGLVSAFIGHLPAGLGVSPWLLLPAGVACMVAVVFLVGRPVPAPSS
jgi:Na+/H+ antiporter NhaC